MNKFPLFLALCVFALGCQKELAFETATAGNNGSPDNVGGQPAAEYFMTFKMDGNARRFNNSNVALVSDLGTGGKNITFIGLAQPSNVSMEGLHMSVYFLKGLPTTGTFKESDHTTDYVVTGDYNANSSQFGYFAGLHTPSVAPLSITITSLSNTVVKGTFSGAFYKKDLNAGPGLPTDYIHFTEGSFSLPIK